MRPRRQAGPPRPLAALGARPARPGRWLIKGTAGRRREGEDAGKLDDKERARLRKQALDWLRADLALYTKQLESGTAAARSLVRQRVQHWQKDSDLAGIRDQAALAKLPAEEQKAFTQEAADVAALLKKAGEKPR